MRNVTKLVAVAMCMLAIGCAPAHMPSLWDVPPETPAEAKRQMRRLASWDPQVRAQACLAVRDLEGPAAEAVAPFVVALLSDETVAWSPSPLLPYVGKPVGLVAEGAVMALREYTMPALADALTSRNVGLRRDATRVLGRIRGPAAEEALRTVLDDPDAEVRARAAVALARMGDSGMFDRVLACLDHDDWRLRVAAIEGLAAIGGPRAIDAISPITQDETPAVKEAAEEALESLRTE